MAIVLAALVMVPTADAARGTMRDARGDAEPPWDITRVVGDNGLRALVVSVHYRAELRLERPLGLLASIYLDFGEPSDSITGDVYATVVRGNETEGGDSLRHSARRGCKGLTASVQVKRRRVVFRVPQRCLGGLAGRVRISARTYLVRGPFSRADSTDWSRWIKRGSGSRSHTPAPKKTRRCGGTVHYGPSRIEVRKTRGTSCDRAKRLAREAVVYRVNNGFPDEFCRGDYCWRFGEVEDAGQGSSRISFTGRRGVRRIFAVQLVS
jgi:hypothetical protein